MERRVPVMELRNFSVSNLIILWQISGGNLCVEHSYTHIVSLVSLRPQRSSSDTLTCFKGTWGRICKKINTYFKFFLMLMSDEVFKTEKKNEHTRVSLHCLEQALRCIMYCNSRFEFPGQSYGRDVR